MKIALINGSPKAKNSVSECILQSLKSLLPVEYEIIEYSFRTPKISDADLVQISESNVLVFAFPLYVDGIPSQLLNCLHQMETYFSTKPTKKINVYSLVNSGFYEGHQNALALEMMKNWCDKAGLEWGQGLGIGGGGMFSAMAGVPEGQGPKKNLSKALKNIADSISTGITAEDIFISPNLPRFVYKLGAEIGWRQQGKANGLKPKDLFAKK
jgi:multimeric flavodoxin WrbA